jgi:F0F1-type ATP synthase assembly protein I
VPRKKTLAAQVGEYTALALLLPISTFVGYGLGYLLDRLFHTHFLYLVFLLFGIASGLIQVIRELARDPENDGGS